MRRAIDARADELIEHFRAEWFAQLIDDRAERRARGDERGQVQVPLSWSSEWEGACVLGLAVNRWSVDVPTVVDDPWAPQLPPASRIVHGVTPGPNGL